MALMPDNCEGILLSLDSHKSSVPAPFLTKTYHLIDDLNTDHIVSWGDEETTFVVWRPPVFARDLLPNYFKHNNFSSFVRQLNTYGFRKIAPHRWEFANEYFKKGEKHLLCEIHRRKTSHPQTAAVNHHPIAGQRRFSPPEYSDANWPSCNSPPCCDNNLASSSFAALSEDNERLRRNNNILICELAHMKKLYNDIIYFVQNHVNGSSFSLMGHNKHLINHEMGAKKKEIIIEEAADKTYKLFGVPLVSKKRLKPDGFDFSSTTNKTRLVLDQKGDVNGDDLGLNLMPPSSCY